MGALGEALQFLRESGFKRVASANPDVRAFEGSLEVSAGSVRVRLEIQDWDFVAYPGIYFLERPSFLPSPMPHIDSSGGLCYFAPGSVVLDRFEPASSIALCLREAEKLLDSVIGNHKRGKDDLRDEFIAYWAGGDGPRQWALLGGIPASASIAHYSLIELPKDRLRGGALIVISCSSGEVERLARAVDGKLAVLEGGHCWILSSAKPPVAPEGRLPSTVKELFAYLRLWDREVYGEIQHILGTDSRYLKAKLASFAIRSPAGWIGFSFDMNPVAKKAFGRKPSIYRQHLHNKGGSTAISRMAISEFGAEFLHSRNLESPSLAGKRVLLVGCGAVGGYIAQALARLGAGAQGGELRLVDPEPLEADNVGRHWLGMSSLFLSKSHAIAAELGRQFPESHFLPECVDVRELPHLFQTDLVVDATGIEAISELINALHGQRKHREKVPALYVWVLGNGEAVQALWVDVPEYGCYRCLRQPRGSQYRQDRFPVLNRAPTLRAAGCGHYRPYAVSAPMSAAALATELIVDWLGGNVSPRFRSVLRDGADVRKQKNQNFGPLNGCPACAK
jgi:hypothetical protein